MMGVGRNILAGVLVVLPAIGWCGYTCELADGRTIHADEIPRECAGREVRELYPDGSPKRVIPAPSTEEQRRENAQDDKDQQACREMNRSQYDKDVALLDRYEHEEDLQEARYGALGDQLRRVDQANARMKEILDRGLDLTREAMFYQPPHQKPEQLQLSRDVNSRLERDQLGVVENAVAQIRDINHRYDTELKRYRELINHTAKMPCNPAQGDLKGRSTVK